MDLTRKQKIKFMFLMKNMLNVEKSKEAYDFMMNYGESTTSDNSSEDLKKGMRSGVMDSKSMTESLNKVFLIYEDGNYEEFNGVNSTQSVVRIGVSFMGNTFAVNLRDLPGKYQLIKDSSECKDSCELYKNEVDSIFDWDAKTHTDHIKKIGTDIPLAENEVIPTSAMLIAMYRLKNKLNEALVYSGGEPLKEDGWYWSSSEYSAYGSWVLNFSSGNLLDYSKCASGYVRPCTAFNL